MAEYWAVAITIEGKRRWHVGNDIASAEQKERRTLMSTRSLALAAASRWHPSVNARVVHITRKPKPKPVVRETLEGLAAIDRSPRAWPPTFVRLGGGGLMRHDIFDRWIASAEGKRVRLTFEVLP